MANDPNKPTVSYLSIRKSAVLLAAQLPEIETKTTLLRHGGVGTS